MRAKITARHIPLSRYTRDLVNKVTEHLERFFRSLARVEWVLQPLYDEIEVRLRIHARSGIYHAHSSHKHIGEAVRAAAEAVERQRRRRKAVTLKEERRSTLSHVMMPQRKTQNENDLTPESFGWEI